MNGDNWPAIASHILGYADVDQMHDALELITRLATDNGNRHDLDDVLSELGLEAHT